MVQVYACMLKTAVINIPPPFRSRLYSCNFSAACFGRNSLNELFLSRLKEIPMKRLRPGPPQSIAAHSEQRNCLSFCGLPTEGKVIKKPLMDTGLGITECMIQKGLTRSPPLSGVMPERQFSGTQFVCSVVASHVSHQPSSAFSFVWIAPPPGTGCVNFL